MIDCHSFYFLLLVRQIQVTILRPYVKEWFEDDLLTDLISFARSPASGAARVTPVITISL